MTTPRPAYLGCAWRRSGTERIWGRAKVLLHAAYRAIPGNPTPNPSPRGWGFGSVQEARDLDEARELYPAHDVGVVRHILVLGLAALHLGLGRQRGQVGRGVVAGLAPRADG